MATTTEEYSTKDYLNALRRRSGLFIGILALLLGISSALAVLLPDTYRATAEMRIDLQGPNVELLEPIALTNYADQYIKSLQQKVMTNENLRAWLEESNAYWYDREGEGEGDLIARLREDIQVQMVFTSVIEEETGEEFDLITGFTTSFASRDPKVAEIIARNVAGAFLEEDRRTRMEKATAASGFLHEQIQTKRDEIADIEARMAEFKEQHAGSMPDLMVLNMTALDRTTQELEQVEREIRTLQQDRFFREAQLQEIRQTAGGSSARLAALEAEYLRAVALYGPDHPDVLRSKRQIAALTGDGAAGGSELARLEAELAALQERYSDQHPDVVTLKRQIETLRTSGAVDASLSDPLYLQLRAQINAIDSNIEGLRARAEELRDERARLQDRIASTPQVERQFLVLQRELQTATLAFDNLRERLAQAQQIESYESGERGARLEQIRAARAPDSPTGPPRIAIALLGLFVATTFAGGATLFAEMSDDTIRGSKDILTVMHTHAIAAIPVVQNSVYRAEKRRRMLVISISALMLGAIIVLIIGAVTA